MAAEPRESRFVYVTYIRTTPQKLWRALIDPEFTRKYWAQTWQDCKWEKGASWRLMIPDGRVGDAGEVLEIEPPRRLVLSWRNEFMPELRAEGVASSQIEGVRAPAELVAVAEHDADAIDTSSAWVADNLAVVDDSLSHARTRGTLGVRKLNAWHRRLMVHGTLPGELVGTFRLTQNWVGGATPRDAAYVPPPAEYVGELMRDLLRFINASKLDLEDLKLTVEDLERFGPTLIVDHQGTSGERVLVWSQ